MQVTRFTWLFTPLLGLSFGCAASPVYATPTTTTYTAPVDASASGYVVVEPDEEEPEVVYEPEPSYVVVEAPPPPQTVIVVRPAPPYPDAIWVPGDWRWNGYHYVWLSGHYVPPRIGYVFIGPRWEYRDHHYVYIRGYYRPNHAVVRRPDHGYHHNRRRHFQTSHTTRPTSRDRYARPVGYRGGHTQRATPPAAARNPRNPSGHSGARPQPQSDTQRRPQARPPRREDNRRNHARPAQRSPRPSSPSQRVHRAKPPSSRSVVRTPQRSYKQSQRSAPSRSSRPSRPSRSSRPTRR